jgi:hypothetical protein
MGPCLEEEQRINKWSMTSKEDYPGKWAIWRVITRHFEITVNPSNAFSLVAPLFINLFYPDCLKYLFFNSFQIDEYEVVLQSDGDRID